MNICLEAKSTEDNRYIATCNTVNSGNFSSQWLSCEIKRIYYRAKAGFIQQEVLWRRRTLHLWESSIQRGVGSVRVSGNGGSCCVRFKWGEPNSAKLRQPCHSRHLGKGGGGDHCAERSTNRTKYTVILTDDRPTHDSWNSVNLSIAPQPMATDCSWGVHSSVLRSYHYPILVEIEIATIIYLPEERYSYESAAWIFMGVIRHSNITIVGGEPPRCYCKCMKNCLEQRTGTFPSTK